MSVVLKIPIPEDVASRLESRAKEEGVDVVTLASRSLTRESRRPLEWSNPGFLRFQFEFDADGCTKQGEICRKPWGEIARF